MELQPHQQRVVTEQEELTTKINALTAFIAGEKFKTVPADEQARLVKQLRVMNEYANILTERISAF